MPPRPHALAVVLAGWLNRHQQCVLDCLLEEDAFRDILKVSGMQVVMRRPRLPNRNAFAERFVRSIKSECLDRMIFVGSASLRRALANDSDHDNRRFSHQGIDDRVLAPEEPSSKSTR